MDNVSQIGAKYACQALFLDRRITMMALEIVPASMACSEHNSARRLHLELAGTNSKAKALCQKIRSSFVLTANHGNTLVEDCRLLRA